MYLLGAIISVIGSLWIVVNAFRNDGILWGIGCLLCGPVLLVYAVLNFADNKIPLALTLGGVALYVATMPAGTMAAAGI